LSLHDAKCQKSPNNYLRFAIHIQIPDQENWEDSEDEIGSGSQGRITDRDILRDRSLETSPSSSSKSSPEIVDGTALHDGEDEIKNSEDGHDCQSDPNDPEVQLDETYSEQAEADGEADEDGCDGVENCAHQEEL
jgi:hypothetical protein